MSCALVAENARCSSGDRGSYAVEDRARCCVARVSANQARGVVERLHLPRRGLCLCLGEPRSIALDASEFERACHTFVAVAGRAIVHHAAVRLGKRGERPSSARQPLSKGFFANAAQLGGFVVREVEHVREDEREPVLSIETAQHRERTTKRDLFDHERVRVFSVGQPVEQVRAESIEARGERLDATLLAVEQVPNGDAIRPRSNRRFSTKGIEPRHHLDEHLLARIASVLGAGCHSKRESIDVVLDCTHDLLERATIARARSGYEAGERVRILCLPSQSGHSTSSIALSTVSSCARARTFLSNTSSGMPGG